MADSQRQSHFNSMSKEQLASDLGIPSVFEVHDASSANWVVRKIVAARAYALNVTDWAAGELRRAEREERFLMWRFGRQLEQFLDRELEENSVAGRNKKSINLPAGRIGRRLQPAKLIVAVEDEAIAWARINCPEALTTSTKLNKTKLNEHFAATGEVPPGVTLVNEDDFFYVK